MKPDTASALVSSEEIGGIFPFSFGGLRFQLRGGIKAPATLYTWVEEDSTASMHVSCPSLLIHACGKTVTAALDAFRSEVHIRFTALAFYKSRRCLDALGESSLRELERMLEVLPCTESGQYGAFCGG